MLSWNSFLLLLALMLLVISLTLMLLVLLLFLDVEDESFRGDTERRIGVAVAVVLLVEDVVELWWTLRHPW